MPKIRLLEPGDASGIETAAQIVRTAYEPVAFRHGITFENCSSFPAFLPGRQLQSALKSSRVYGYGMYEEAEMVGFYMLRHMEEDKTLDISRLAVLPGRQGGGIGTTAIGFMEEQGLALSAEKLHASLMDEDVESKEWFIRRGFVQAGRLKYAGLPYRVAFMEKSIGT